MENFNTNCKDSVHGNFNKMNTNKREIAIVSKEYIGIINVESQGLIGMELAADSESLAAIATLIGRQHFHLPSRHLQLRFNVLIEPLIN